MMQLLTMVPLNKQQRATQIAAARKRIADAEQKRRDAKRDRDAQLAERRAAKKRGR